MTHSYPYDPVAHLQNSDFDKNAKIINPLIPKDKPVIIFIYADFCGYCKKAMPAFQKFAEENKNKAFMAAIQGDGKYEGEPIKFIDKICPGFRGFPSYVAIYNGKNIVHDGGRSKEDLEKFLQEVLNS